MPAASQKRAPTQGNVSVLAVAAAASAVQDLGHDNAKEEHYHTFISDVDLHITFSDTATIADPDPAAVAGDGRTWPMFAGVEKEFWIDTDSRYYKVLGSGAGFLRHYQS